MSEFHDFQKISFHDISNENYGNPQNKAIFSKSFHLHFIERCYESFARKILKKKISKKG